MPTASLKAIAYNSRYTLHQLTKSRSTTPGDQCGFGRNVADINIDVLGEKANGG
jgi:hypothetical protein